MIKQVKVEEVENNQVGDQHCPYRYCYRYCHHCH